MKKKTGVGKPSGKVIRASKGKADKQSGKNVKTRLIKIKTNKQQNQGATPRGKSGQTMGKK